MIIPFPKDPPSTPEVASGLHIEKHHRPDSCTHENVTINVQAATLKCEDCGAYLDAFAYMVEWSRKKEYWQRCQEEREQHQLDHVQETKAAALEACEFYKITPEEYAAWWKQKPCREKAREELKARYDRMVELHSTDGCTPETMYVISNRKDWFELWCYVCGGMSGRTSLPPEFSGALIHRHRDRIFQKIKR
jgi:hypothetical protein